jgi:DNA-binding response OmpR family regulator
VLEVSRLAERDRVLVVDDDAVIRWLVRDGLEREGFDVSDVEDGASALARLEGDRPNLVILDVNLPERGGFDVLSAIRAGSNVPVILLTGRVSEIDRVLGLELGADDYVVKPFSPKELVARVRAVLRRSGIATTASEAPLRVGDVSIDPSRLRVTAGDRSIELTPTEFQLLATLAREPGRVFTRGQLLDAIHGVAFASYERAIDAHVKNIRRKLEPEPARPRYVLTVHGVGYRFSDA